MEDLMRAKDILGAVKRNKERIDPAEEDGGVITGYRLAHDQITEIINRCIPTVRDVKPVVRGKWIRGNESATSPAQDSYTCSVCGDKALAGFCGIPARTNYCPNCGADMREEQEHNG